MEVRVERVLKTDALGRIELLVRGEERRVRRVACGSRLPCSRALARVLAARERRALERLAPEATGLAPGATGLAPGATGLAPGATGLAPGSAPGLSAPRLELDRTWHVAASLDGRAPHAADVLVRSFVAGVALPKAETLPRNFFELLAAEVRALHARGVCHNDLHKEQNVIVAPDGRPGLVDFQLASVHRPGSFTWRARSAEDLRHVEKHRRRYMRIGRGPEGAEIDVHAVPKPRRGPLAFVWRKLGKPLYNFATRKLFSARDGAEERRPSSGPWPRWTEPLQ
ncbi:MAG: phosphotransferase [Planctomycetes bacterium]|nr:phosphotransferase [Planctomycetota bacterium]